MKRTPSEAPPGSPEAPQSLHYPDLASEALDLLADALIEVASRVEATNAAPKDLEFLKGVAIIFAKEWKSRRGKRHEGT